jgi:D-alanyl-lipoteichoic acid acyltransferase DltB (MBOAT superfamily)
MLSWISIDVLGLALVTAILLAVLGGTARQLVFLAANLIFICGLLLGPRGALSTIAFALVGYVLIQQILVYPKRGFVLCVLAYVLLFVYMRDYDFLSWVLPDAARTNLLATVGLSFLFFKIVHVMIDARSGTLGNLTFMNYLNYSLNFTTFMMGPIQRYQDFDAQWHGRQTKLALDFESHLDAVLRILVGLVKAYVLAPALEPYSIQSTTNVEAIHLGALLVQIYAFYFYLYLNFAGYCDIVIGIGGLLGVQPPENFDKPFLARDISEFWQRFHRSLTSWLTDYIFSPSYKWVLTQTGGQSYPLLALNGALLLTMLVSGLWHGTTPSFVVFGLLQGLYFVVFRTWEAVLIDWLGRRGLRALRKRWWAQVLGIIITFNAVAFSLVFFRIDVRQGLELLARFFGY